jgi:hypothetical protein
VFAQFVLIAMGFVDVRRAIDLNCARITHTAISIGKHNRRRAGGKAVP